MEVLLSHVLDLCIAAIEIRSAEQSQIMVALRMLHPNVRSSCFQRREFPIWPFEKLGDSFVARSGSPVDICAIMCLEPAAHHSSNISK